MCANKMIHPAALQGNLKMQSCRVMCSSGGFVNNHLQPRVTDLHRRGVTAKNSSCSTRCKLLYTQALNHTRAKEYEEARTCFEECTKLCPEFSFAWVSWAQMEKRTERESAANSRFQRCRRVLQMGLVLNPGESRLCQSWGFLELQRGNLLAAVILLERSVASDPERCAPVLRWKLVRNAQQTVGSRRRSRMLSDS